MTLAHERTRSVIQAKEFLTAITQNSDIPESLRRQAKSILRHYPSKDEMYIVGKREAASPLALGSPLFASTEEG